MKADYPQDSVQPIQVQKTGDHELTITYTVPMETAFWSEGVDYSHEDGRLKVYIRRCELNMACTPMVKSDIPLDDRWSARVRVPYQGGEVVMVHADGEQHIYP